MEQGSPGDDGTHGPTVEGGNGRRPAAGGNGRPEAGGNGRPEAGGDGRPEAGGDERPAAAPGPPALPWTALHTPCDPADIPYESTEEAEAVDDAPGQERAAEAFAFGLAMDAPGYNMLFMGAPGVGRHTLARAWLERYAMDRPVPCDWVYVQCLEDPRRPMALELTPGRAADFAADMRRLVEALVNRLPEAFEGESYRTRKHAIERENRERQHRSFVQLEASGRDRGVSVVRTPGGVALGPMLDGEPIGPDELHRLTDADHARLREAMREMQQEVHALHEKVASWDAEERDHLRDLNREITSGVVSRALRPLRARYGDLPKVVAWLESVERDVVDRARDFLEASAPTPEEVVGLATKRAPEESETFARYQVNVLVDHDARHGAPVVFESHPTLANLVGRVDHVAHFGTLVTDFRMIRPGALHRANGGYLVMDAAKVLGQYQAWDQLKEALRSREIRIRSLGEVLSLASTAELEPAPIPLDVKVILVGEPVLFHLLGELDPDLAAIFKVVVDFGDELPRDRASVGVFARQLAGMVRGQRLRPFGRDAVARVIEEAARMTDDAEKLSVHYGPLADLLREAHGRAVQVDAPRVTAQCVESVVETRRRLTGRIRDDIRESIARGQVLLDTRDLRVGQINGLAVGRFGRSVFGRPTRITARVRLGAGEVVDIERAAQLGGRLHSKSVMIISGYLAGHYLPDRPLALSASLVFEQSYGGVEGDSASLAELCALLSAIGRVPLRQELGVTGSVDQLGQIQAVGGVNDKIEGFFDACSVQGLTGTQGVVLPAANLPNLMLRREVVEAARAGRFHVYPVRTVDEALELLTGLPAGARRLSGAFPEGSVNGRVEGRLLAFFEKARAAGGVDGHRRP